MSDERPNGFKIISAAVRQNVSNGWWLNMIDRQPYTNPREGRSIEVPEGFVLSVIWANLSLMPALGAQLAELHVYDNDDLAVHAAIDDWAASYAQIAPAQPIILVGPTRVHVNMYQGAAGDGILSGSFYAHLIPEGD